MFKSLFSKLAVVLFALFCVTALFFILLTIFSTDMYQSEINQKLNLKLAENIVAEKILMKDNRIDRGALEEIFHMLMVINPSIEIYLIDPEGRILSYSAPPEKVRLKKVDMASVNRWFSKDRVLPVMGEDPRNPEKQKAITVARIPKEGPLEGYLYVILGGEIYDGIMQKLKGSYILQISFWAIVAVTVLAVAAGFMIFAFLTRRLRTLAEAMDEFKNNNTILKPLKKRSERRFLADEVDRLDRAFFRMAEHIKNQMDEIYDSDTQRRELIANISHDLRTPLATLQGYVETLLAKEKTLEPEQRESYLMTVHRHCIRLNRLVEQLFELAKLDTGDSSPQYESFSITDLIQDLVQKFQLTAESRKIKLESTPQQDLPFVYADIGMIERVFENLIENAFQYTDEGGTISVEASSDGMCVKISVKDNGRGIPEEELEHIFDRFYRVDKSRKSQTGHSGLGLAITRRIIELHQSNISVESFVGAGSNFSFTLSLFR